MLVQLGIGRIPSMGCLPFVDGTDQASLLGPPPSGERWLRARAMRPKFHKVFFAPLRATGSRSNLKRNEER